MEIKYICLGDSHISLFSNVNDTHVEGSKVFIYDIFKGMNLGPYLAYNLIREDRKKEIVEKYNRLNTENCNNIIFSFGEIDLMHHVQKQSILQNKTPEQIIDKIIENYFSFLTLFENKNIFLLESHSNKYFNEKLSQSKFNIIKKYEVAQNNKSLVSDGVHLNPSIYLPLVRQYNNI